MIHSYCPRCGADSMNGDDCDTCIGELERQTFHRGAVLDRETMKFIMDEISEVDIIMSKQIVKYNPEFAKEVAEWYKKNK